MKNFKSNLLVRSGRTEKRLNLIILGRISFERRQTKTKVITTVNDRNKGNNLSLMRIGSKNKQTVKALGNTSDETAMGFSFVSHCLHMKVVQVFE